MLKVWESDCSNYGGCHPWFYGGDTPQSLPLMISHWESVYGRGHNYILNLPPSKAGVIEPHMAAAAAAFGVERHRRYGAGSSDPDTPSACELARVGGRLAQWSRSSSFPAAAAAAAATAGDGAVVAGYDSSKHDPSAAAPATELLLHFDEVTVFDRVFLSEDVTHDGQLYKGFELNPSHVCSLASCSAAAATPQRRGV